MKIYYGLTADEAKSKVLKYNGSERYDCKGVNTSLSGLKKFVKDNKMESLIQYYTILDSKIFDINNEILFDKEYDMIAVKIPFEFKIKSINKLF